MTRFNFLHIADAHLGGRFAGLARRSEAAAAEMAAACLNALDAAIDVALERRVAFVIIAGDLFDRATPDLRESFAAAERLARLWREGIDVYWLLGNHDHGGAAKALPNSERLRRFSTRAVQSFEIPDLNVALHGRSFGERSAPENFARAYPRAKPGRFEIGVLHTSLDGREGASTYAPCALGDLAAAGYGYWALGHVHGAEIVSQDPYVVYPGCLQGRNAREVGAKGCVMATVEDGAVAELEQIACDRVRWVTARTDLSGLDARRIETEIEAATRAALEDARDAADGRFAIVRLRHGGAGAADQALRRQGQARLLEQASRLALEIDARMAIEAVKIDTTPPEEDDAGLAADAAALLRAAAADPALLDALRGEVDQISAKAAGAFDREDPRFAPEAMLEAATRRVLAGRAPEELE